MEDMQEYLARMGQKLAEMQATHQQVRARLRARCPPALRGAD